MTTTDQRREPIFNVPPVVTALLAVLVAIHGVRQLLPEATDEWLVLALAFNPDRYVGHAEAWPGGSLAAWTSPVTHMAVHGDLTHLALNGASLLAFGGVIARRVGALRFVLFTLMAGLAGAALFLAFNWGLEAPVVGASGAIAGMMAVALRLLFSAIDAPVGSVDGSVGDLLRQRPGEIPLMSLSATLQDRRMQSATLVWIAINGLAAYGLGLPAHVGAVAWEAHIGGFLAGLLAFDLFDRPGPVLAAGAGLHNPGEAGTVVGDHSHLQ